MPRRPADGPAPRAARVDDSAPLHDIDSPAWTRAKALLDDLKDALNGGRLSADDAQALARRWDISVRTVWRRAKACRAQAGIRGVLPRKSGAPAGVGRLRAETEGVIRDVARQWWKQTENATIAEILPTVLATCRARDLPEPSRATVARRLAALRRDPDMFAGDVAAALRERSRLVKSSYMVDAALDVVQIDHTVADVFVIDPVTRACIGRPTLTIAIDVATRCVLGFCLSLEAPSALVVALCLEQAVAPKASWLQARGIDVPWAVHGVPAALHVDNGREFRSGAFRRGTDLNGIALIYRPPGTPRFGVSVVIQ